MNIGNAIKSIRIERGLKQKDLATKISVRPEFLSKIENNDKKPSWVTLSEIANCLEVSVPHILIKSLGKDDFKPGKEHGFLEMKYSLEKLLNDIVTASKNQ